MEPYQIFCSIILNQKVVLDDIDHENIFETIERSSCDTETTPVSSQHKKNVNRQHLMKKQQKYQLVYDLSDLVCHRSLDF